MNEIYVRRGTETMPRAVKMITIDALTGYNANRRALANLRSDRIPSATQCLSPTAGVQVSHAENRTTETVAMSIVTTPYYDRLTQTINAVEKLINSLSPTDRRLIYYVYVCATPITAEAAADLLGMSKTVAYNRINAILTQLARDLGYIPPAA